MKSASIVIQLPTGERVERELSLRDAACQPTEFMRQAWMRLTMLRALREAFAAFPEYIAIDLHVQRRPTLVLVSTADPIGFDHTPDNYRCPVCGIADRNAYLRCNRGDCTDGRDPR